MCARANPTRPDPRVGARVRRPRRPPSPPSEDDTGGKRTKRNITHPNPTRRRDDASSTPRSIADRSIADRSRTDRVIITRETPGEGWFVSSSNDGRDARATARSSSLPSPTAGGEKMTRIGRRHRNEPSSSRVVGRRRASSGIPPIADDDGDGDDGALEESTPRALYPVPVVRRPRFSLLCFSIQLFAVARSRSHRRAVEVARTIVGSLRVRECRAPATSRPRPLVPSIRHPSDPSDPSVRSIYPSVRSNRPENRILSPGVLYCTVYKYYVSGLMVFTGVRYKYVVRKENPRVLCISCLYT